MERYRSIVDDWEAFRAALLRPQPATVRVNVLRTDVDSLRRRLEPLGFRLQPMGWYPSLLLVEDGPFPITRTLEHWLGYLYAQGAAAAVPVLALEPRPGETVLDLSAAPGGKTAQIAELQGDTGLLVANDPQSDRVRALLANVYRLGLTSAVVTAYDGRALPQDLLYDRALVDAPCSAEGNARRSRRAARPVSPRRAASLANLQRSLLTAGLARVRDGGIVVYATCTFAPEENEAVIDVVLRETRGTVVIEPVDDRLPGIPGITRWEGRTFDSAVGAARRIYPHHLDSGGMFLARLRRLGPPPWAEEGQGEPSWIEADDDLRGRLVAWWCERFEAPAEAFDGLHAFERGGDVWLYRHPRIPDWPNLQAAGLRVARAVAGGWKPTTLGLVRFAQGARRNVVDLDAEGVAALLQGRRVTPAGPGPVEPGFVILRWAGEVLGCGILDDRGVRSAIPQGRAQELLACVEAYRSAGLEPLPRG